jgi:AP-1 complex subunit mu
VLSPVVHDDAGVSYMFIQHNNVFLLTASRQNCNAASILLFLHRVVDVWVAAPIFTATFCVC